MNEGLLKNNISILISKTFSPAEIFLFEYALKEIINIKYKLVFEEDLIKEKPALIIWDNYLNIVDKGVVIHSDNLSQFKNTLLNQEYYLFGLGEHYENIKLLITKVSKAKVLEYENSDMILFERAK